MFDLLPVRSGWAAPVLVLLGLGQPGPRAHCAAPLTIKPGFRIVLAGEQADFAAQGGVPCRWGLVEPEGGSAGAAGRYAAPMVGAVRVFHLRADPLDQPGPPAEATVLVLPREPFGAGAAPPEPSPGPPLPFLDPATERRSGDAPVQFWSPGGPAAGSPRQTVGCGLPLVLRWPSRPGVAGERLSYREGGRWVCRDVTGMGCVVLHPRDPIDRCAVESLDPPMRPSGPYLSQLRELPVSVRGLLALAGDPAEAGQGDGRGAAARFSEPHGMAVVGCGQFASRQTIVADPGSHVLRAVSAGGEVTTPWGRPFEPGWRDGPCALFNGPTFVAGLPCSAPGGSWEPFAGFLVADSGNQVIRRVDRRGEVATWAGTPGQAGFRDAGDPRLALFSDPRGLALDSRGNVYVADRGNQVIRRIAPDGAVTTLAGAPERSGTRDGRGTQARFSGLQGLAMDGDRALFAVDGHAVRRITLAGEVATVLGVPDRAGFRDDWETGRGRCAGAPCLDRPCGLAAAGGRIYIADTGNRAVREFDPATGTLKTLAGGPDLGENRAGLLRDGIPGPLDGAQAGLEAPRGLAVCEQGRILVATGPWLAQLCRQRLNAPAGAAELRLAGRGVPRDVPLGVDWTVPACPPEDEPVLYSMTFIQADGSVERRVGIALGGAAVREEGRFALAGPGRVVLQWVTRRGVSRGAEAGVQVD